MILASVEDRPIEPHIYGKLIDDRRMVYRLCNKQERGEALGYPFEKRKWILSHAKYKNQLHVLKTSVKTKLEDILFRDKIEYLYDLDVRHDSLKKMKKVTITKNW